MQNGDNMTNKRKPKKYSTPKHEPKCVKYWDKKFRPMNVWFDWVMLKSRAENQVLGVKSKFGVNKATAREIVWGSFVAAINDEDNSPMENEYTDFLVFIQAQEYPLVLAYLLIGSDVFFGWTESEAIELYRKWALKNPNDTVFGDYRVTHNFKVIPYSPDE